MIEARYGVGDYTLYPGSGTIYRRERNGELRRVGSLQELEAELLQPV